MTKICPNCGDKLQVEPNANDPDTLNCPGCGALYYLDHSGRFHKIDNY